MLVSATQAVGEGWLGPNRAAVAAFTLGLLLTFLFVRLNTRLIRANVSWWFHDIESEGGVHVHHMVIGVVVMIAAGISIIALQPQGLWTQLLAATFGVGVGLTLDEFALILRLQDVYWTTEGRMSVDAVIVAVSVGLLLVLGQAPLGNAFTVQGSGIAVDVVIALVIAIDVLLAVICLFKGKLWTGFFALFIPVVGWFGALRVARPGSPWAHRRYQDKPKKLAKAQRREDRINRTWRAWRTAFFDLLAGKPHLPSIATATEGTPGDPPRETRGASHPAREPCMTSAERTTGAVPAPAKRSYFVRSIFAGRDIELFLVTAVATILIVRSILAASGWPQLGGGKIHFAHLLWGGLGMLIALVLFMAMEGRMWKQLATLSAGIGFGLFIDELGKFVTSDNDYFFRPAVAFMYLVFVALFLVARLVLSRADLSPQASLVNAFDLAKEAVVRDLDEAERGQILTLLARCDQDDPVVRDLIDIVAGAIAPSGGSRDPYQRLKAGLRGLYDRLVAQRWFKALLFAYLALIALVGVLWAVGVVAVLAGSSTSLELDFWGYGQFVSASVSAVFIAVGFVRWRRSRLAAYRWFERALLVAIFVTQFFAFYENQTTQAVGLIVVLLTYAAVAGMTAEEEAREKAAGAWSRR